MVTGVSELTGIYDSAVRLSLESMMVPMESAIRPQQTDRLSDLWVEHLIGCMNAFEKAIPQTAK